MKFLPVSISRYMRRILCFVLLFHIILGILASDALLTASAKTLCAAEVQNTKTPESDAADTTPKNTAPAAQEGSAPGADLSISAPSALLMEASTGTVIYEKNAHEILRPASITKIMTLILIFDALAKGQIQLEDTVTVSEYAASMGGSQVFLEAGETQTVDTMIKCISVASANDACVAMAEHISGSESEFVRQMNERA